MAMKNGNGTVDHWKNNSGKLPINYERKSMRLNINEYFLGEFALAEGKKGGQFYTPRSVVTLLVEMLEPFQVRVLDPCWGSGGMFVQSEKFVTEHHGKVNDISIYGQESNQTIWRLCKMNLAIRGIDSSQVRWNNEGSFLNDAHKDLKADFIIANPSFNVSDWCGDLLRKDGRWQHGVPPTGNANYAWIQHLLYHLAPNGQAGFVLAKGSLTTKTSGEGDIRKALIELDYVLTPGRYVGLPDDGDDLDFDERFTALKADLEEQLKEEARPNEIISTNLSKNMANE